MTLNVQGVSASSAQVTVSATDPQSLPLTYTLATSPTVGSASVDPNSGTVTYTVAGHTTAASDTFTVRVANSGAASTGTVNVTLHADPLLANQWHIQNTGQDAFASVRPVAGNDMNLIGAWSAGHSGKNIKVAVVDTGLEASHEDLAANVDVARSFNFLTGLSDPSRLPNDAGHDHGTSVAGIIGAMAFNGKGGRGVAYTATLRGYNLIAPGAFSLANMAKSLGSDPLSADVDIFNASFGPTAPALPQFSGAFQAISANSFTLRAGLGAPIVNAAGNEFDDWEGTPGLYCATANKYGVSCGDPANDERRGGFTPIIVGATNANGRHSSYSTTGSALWISAPGGEYGLNSTYVGPGPANLDPAITTTSRTGCAHSQYPNPVNSLDAKGAHPFAANCQYTATMNGTSSATPNVAGVVALMLEANPNLSVRDVKHILAKTAKRVDPTFAGKSATDIIPGNTVVLEQGWVTNAAGNAFSNWYGFGGVDATAAVAVAKNYVAYMPPLRTDTGNYRFIATAPAIIPAFSTIGGFIDYMVAEPFSIVETVVIFVSIDSTPNMLCNQIELTSPAGTKSILLHAANGFINASVANSRFISNAFYGEAVNGLWRLRFLDFCPATFTSTRLSSTAPQVLLFQGH